MKDIPNNIIDLIITDPPFAIDLNNKQSIYNRKKSNIIAGYKEIEQKDYYKFTLDWMNECFRILKDNASMYVFSGWTNIRDILNAINKTGFIEVNHISWKYQFGVFTKRKFVTSHYTCFYLCKNDKKRKFFPYSRFGKNDKDDNGRSLSYRDKEDVWYIKREYWKGVKKTQTKLPAEIIKKILAYSSIEGDLVFDPFMGSGQTIIVSKLNKRKYLGFEIVKDYFDFIQKRLDSNSYGIDTKN